MLLLFKNGKLLVKIKWSSKEDEQEVSRKLGKPEALCEARWEALSMSLSRSECTMECVSTSSSSSSSSNTFSKTEDPLRFMSERKNCWLSVSVSSRSLLPGPAAFTPLAKGEAERSIIELECCIMRLIRWKDVRLCKRQERFKIRLESGNIFWALEYRSQISLFKFKSGSRFGTLFVLIVMFTTVHRVQCIYISIYIYAHAMNRTGEGRKSKGKKTCMLIPGPGVAHTYIYVAGPGTASVRLIVLLLLLLCIVVAVNTSGSCTGTNTMLRCFTSFCYVSACGRTQ